MYKREKDYSKALINLNQALNLKPDHSHLLKVRASVKEDSGDRVGAISDYKESLSISGSDWYATYNQIAVNYINLKNFEKAILSFDIAIELKDKLKNNGIDEENDTIPFNIDGVIIKVPGEKMYTNRANAKLSLDDKEGAFKDCQKAIEINPNYPNSFFVMGLIYLQIGDKKSALVALKQAEKNGDKNVKAVIQQYF